MSSTPLAVVSDSGGQGGIAADVAAAVGLDTPVFSSALQEALADLLPVGASVANPIDLAGAGEGGLGTYADVCERLVASGEVDAVLVSGYLGCYGEDSPSLVQPELAVVDRLGDLAHGKQMPLVVHSMSAGSRAVSRMWEHRIPAFRAVESALLTLAHAHHLTAHPGRAIPQVATRVHGVRHGYWSAREVLHSIGVPMPNAALIRDVEDARCAGQALRVPLVLKAGWLEHKSEHGGVVLGIQDTDALVAAYEEMHHRLGDGEYVVEEQDHRADVVEILIGARCHRDFGPTITVGAGGTATELWRDFRLELAPVSHDTARSMLDELTTRKLLAGWRGKPAVDVEALASLIVAVSEVLCADLGIQELELNPVRVGPGGVLAVDALITQAPGAVDVTDLDPVLQEVEGWRPIVAMN